MQGGNRDNCLICADKIKSAVTNLTAALPTVCIQISILFESISNVTLQENGNEVSKRLLDSALQLQMNSACLQTANKANDLSQTDYYLHKVRENAYEIAKDTKEIITKYTC